MQKVQILRQARFTRPNGEYGYRLLLGRYSDDPNSFVVAAVTQVGYDNILAKADVLGGEHPVVAKNGKQYLVRCADVNNVTLEIEP